MVVDSDGTWWLPYELELANIASVPVVLESVEVLDPAKGDAVVTTLAGDALGAKVVQAGAVKSATLGAGQSAVLFVNARFERREDGSLVVTGPDWIDTIRLVGDGVEYARQ